MQNFKVTTTVDGVEGMVLVKASRAMVDNGALFLEAAAATVALFAAGLWVSCIAQQSENSDPKS